MKRKGLSPVQRSLKLLRDDGYAVEVVEQFVTRGKLAFRKDVFGLFDILGTRRSSSISCRAGAIGIQCCRRNDIASHKAKALTMPMLLPWLLAGNAFVIHGWHTWDKQPDRRDEVKVCEAIIINGAIEWMDSL